MALFHNLAAVSDGDWVINFTSLKMKVSSSLSGFGKRLRSQVANELVHVFYSISSLNAGSKYLILPR